MIAVVRVSCSAIDDEAGAWQRRRVSQRAWGRELLLYAASVAGCALLVWDVASEALDAPAPGDRKALAWLAIGLAAAGIATLRRLPADRARPPIALRLVAVLLPLAIIGAVAYACTTQLDGLVLRDREIEGLTIALPEGNEAPNPQHAANIMISDVGGHDVAAGVLWQIGEFSDSGARALADAGAAMVGAHATPAAEAFVVGAGLAHRAFVIDASAGEEWTVVFACGNRVFDVIVGGAGTAGLTRRILASVRCHPSAEQALASVPVVVDLPPKWQRAAGEPGQLIYEAEHEALVIRAIDVVSEEHVEGTLESAARHMGAGAKLGARHEVVSPDGAHPVWAGTKTEDGQAVAFQISLWRCPARKLTLLAFHVGGGDERAGLELFEHLRCARPDEPITR